MKAIGIVIPALVLGCLSTAAAQEPGVGAQPEVSVGEIQLAEGWRDKLDALKRKGGQDKKKGVKDDGKDELPKGDCVAYPIGCGPGYTNPKLTGIDCGGRSEIGCLCWKNLASKQECDAYRAKKNKK